MYEYTFVGTSLLAGGFDFLRSLKKFLSAFHAKIYGYASERKRLADRTPSQIMQYLLDTYGNSILRLAYSYVHNMSDAEDLLQDTLITYLDSAPEFENETHEKAWLLKVTANLSKNKIAYNRLRMTDELDER
ncbi:MAG: sigma factor [Lachnospiraceae bacterium]